MKIGRNDPCHCGSGKKYKKCCMPKDQEAERTQRLALAPKPVATVAQPDDVQPPLESHQLLDAQQRLATLHNLHGLDAELLKLWEKKGTDPALAQGMRRWPEDAGLL